MMPDQSQGACQAIEDAAALGLVFSKDNFNGDIREALEVFEEVRKPRGTKVQAASARARENINERIGEVHGVNQVRGSRWTDGLKVSRVTRIQQSTPWRVRKISSPSMK
jgi:2-polyprenyl-6-methoxyphenol hydroxylase-like FAD-dependent oxidoreductase